MASMQVLMFDLQAQLERVVFNVIFCISLVKGFMKLELV